MGLDTMSTRAHIELALRRSGIIVLSMQDWTRDKRAPYLHVNIGIFSHSDEPVESWNGNLGLVQQVQIMCVPPREAPATTWQSENGYGYAGPAHVKEQIYLWLDKSLDEFANDWLAEHPRR